MSEARVSLDGGFSRARARSILCLHLRQGWSRYPALFKFLLETRTCCDRKIPILGREPVHFAKAWPRRSHPAKLTNKNLLSSISYGWSVLFLTRTRLWKRAGVLQLIVDSEERASPRLDCIEHWRVSDGESDEPECDHDCQFSFTILSQEIALRQSTSNPISPRTSATSHVLDVACSKSSHELEKPLQILTRMSRTTPRGRGR